LGRAGSAADLGTHEAASPAPPQTDLAFIKLKPEHVKVVVASISPASIVICALLCCSGALFGPLCGSSSTTLGRPAIDKQP
jgi:hypothetical protein